MPKSKKPRKKRKPQAPKAKVINKYPHCKYCLTETRLATTAELAHYKAADPTMDMEFLFVPQCECWEQHPEDWMAL